MKKGKYKVRYRHGLYYYKIRNWYGTILFKINFLSKHNLNYV